MNFPGYLTQHGDGFECAGCGDQIEKGQSCIRVDHAEVQTNEIGNPRVQSQGYAGVYHVDCI